MLRYLKYLLSSGLIAGVSFSTMAQRSDIARDGILSTAVPFLRITPDARSGGMGNADIAVSPDANAAFCNLSKLPFSKNKGGISISYSPWLKQFANDMFLGYLSGFKKLNKTQVLAISVRYFNLGNVQFRNRSGEALGAANPREYSFDVGYARKLSMHWSLGVALRFIHSSLTTGYSQRLSKSRAGHSIAGDISVFYTNKRNYGGNKRGTWRFGTTITNIGSKIGYSNNDPHKYFLPINMGLGGAYTYSSRLKHKITFAIDICKLLVPTPPILYSSDGDVERMQEYYNQSVIGGIFKSFTDAPGGASGELKELQYSFGIEYWFNNLIAIRAGYYSKNKEKGNQTYFTTGFGLEYQQFGLNFSYLIPSGNGVINDVLSKTLRLSLLFHLNNSSN